MKTISRYIMTLALLLTAVTGAWAQEPEINVTEVSPVTVLGATKQWTFEIPGSDVVQTPIYAPTADFNLSEGSSDKLPAPVEGIFIGSTNAIITEGVCAQGSLMYAVSTSATEAPALTAFSATLPTAKDITAAGDVYVWYYIKGADTPQGQTATAENTFNDSKICAEPIKVTVLSNKFDIQFNAANANTIEAGKAAVTVGGTAATVTDGKLQGVKMGSEVKVKANTGYKFRKVEVKKTSKLLSITISGVTVYYAEGESWADAIKRDENKDLGLFIREGNRVHHPTYGQLVDSNTQPVLPDAKINANESYKFIN